MRHAAMSLTELYIDEANNHILFAKGTFVQIKDQEDKPPCSVVPMNM